MPDEPIPFILKHRGMADLERRQRREALAEEQEIIRQCTQAAREIEEKYPIASRLLIQEARRWQ